ncbi:MAG: BTAD domain-containing putative transcriptional regulator [Acidimicrobiales bacterium]
MTSSALDAVEWELAAGSARVTLEMARGVMDSATEPGERARAALVLGRALFLCEDEAAGCSMLANEGAATEQAVPETAALMHAHAAAGWLWAGRFSEARGSAKRGVANAATASSDRVRLLCDATLGAVLMAENRTGEARRTLPPVEDLLAVVDPVRDAGLVAMTMGMALVWGEDYHEARRLLTSLDALGREAECLSALPVVLLPLALIEHRLCAWSEAERAAADALELCQRAEQVSIEPFIAAELATIEAVLGRSGSCRSRALGLLDSSAGNTMTIRAAALSALGLLELGEGRMEAAAHWFEVLAASLPAPERPTPGVIMWEADLIDAYIGLERWEQARRTLERFEARSQLSRSHRAALAVLRCRAALASEPHEAEALFAEALDCYQGSTWRFARARALMARGEGLVGDGRTAEADALLREALAELDGMGARGWCARVTDMLEQLKAPPGPSSDALTDQESQVALAAAAGSDVAAIASGLFVSEELVRDRLDAALAKLGVEHPTGLATPEVLGRLSGGQVLDRADLAQAAPPIPRDLPRARIGMLGSFTVEVDGKPCSLGDSVTAQAMKMVALAGKIPVEELIEGLWPGADPETGRARLRSLLSRMRRQAGPVLERQDSWVTLGDQVTVDVERFEACAQQAQAATLAGDERAGELADLAAELYSGELLPTDRHLDFTAVPRERLRRRYLAVAEVAADHACELGRLETAVRRIEGALAADPFDEHLYLKAATILADDGRTGQALSVVRRAELALAELDLTLSADIVALRTQLRRVADHPAGPSVHSE